MGLVGAKFAVRPLYDEDSGSSAGWQIIEIKAEDNGSAYGAKYGEVLGNLLNISSLAFVNLILSEHRDRLSKENVDASTIEESRRGRGQPAPNEQSDS